MSTKFLTCSGSAKVVDTYMRCIYVTVMESQLRQDIVPLAEVLARQCYAQSLRHLCCRIGNEEQGKGTTMLHKLEETLDMHTAVLPEQ